MLAASALSRSAAACRAVAPYLLVALCSALLVCGFFKVWKADLGIPLTYANYGSDDAFQAAITKTTLETGSYLVNCHLAAPGCQNHYDFPLVDSFHLQSLALLARMLGNLFLALNLYYLGGPIFTSLCSLYVLRQLGAGVSPAFCGTLLYSFLTCFFKRGMAHYSLALYGLCPFLLLFCIWILRSPGQDTLFAEGGGKGVSWNRKKIGLAIGICILVGCTNIYYSLFFCMLLAFGTAVALLRRPRMATLVVGAALSGAVVLSVGCNLVPAKIFAMRYGPDPEAVARNFEASEVYALKLDQMLLPATGHRIPMLARLKARYNATAPLVNENDFASLGMVLSAGFVLLLVWNLVGRKLVDPERELLVGDIATLNWAAFILATMGGGGALIAFFVSDKIRAYNRVTPVIAFFSVAALVICADSWLSKSRGLATAYLKAATLIALTLWGLFDQSTVQHLEAYYRLGQTSFHSDQAFVQRIEAQLAPQAMVFQLPYHTFPEGGPQVQMTDYDEFRPFLHSKRIHWSYGGLRGRWEDAWSREVGSLVPQDMLKILSFAGFEGITVDRNGYADHGRQIEEALTRIVGSPKVVSKDERNSFFRLSGYAGQLRASLPASTATTIREGLQHAVFMSIQGCSGLEVDKSSTWRWCDSDVDLIFYNGMQAGHVSLDATLMNEFTSPSNISIEGPGISDRLQVSASGTSLHKIWPVLPGRSVVHIHTDAPNLIVAGDPRPLRFRFVNLELHETAVNNNGQRQNLGRLVPSVSDKFLIMN
jgi:phosphoglycerol transferase